MADSTANQTDTGGHEALSKPIPGPNQVGPDYLLEPDMRKPMTIPLYIARALLKTVQIPTAWIRKNVVEANKGPKYYYYHRKYPRALPIDECYLDDMACMNEADLEYQRNRKVDRETLKILKYRRDNCWYWHSTNEKYFKTNEACKDLEEAVEREETNFHIKHGDSHVKGSVLQAFMRQKHRMIVERRNAAKQSQTG